MKGIASGVMGFLSGLRRPLSVFGPSLTKELRGSSRRLRHYALRFGYVGALGVFVAAVWMENLSNASGVYHVSRMAEAGKSIIAAIIWFEFIAAQFIAVVLMSTSISGEVTRRTLGVLMTTPLTGWQVVGGKLLGGICQLLGLLAISFPVLAIVRVFGGVPWSFVVAALGITVTACIFTGAVTMAYSILLRKTFVIIIVSLATILGIYLAQTYLMLPMLALKELAFLGSPAGALGVCTAELFSPGRTGIGIWWWPINSAVMCLLSGFVLWFCARQVRKVALRQITGDLGAVAIPQTLVPLVVGKAQRQWRQVRTHAEVSAASPLLPRLPVAKPPPLPEPVAVEPKPEAPPPAPAPPPVVAPVATVAEEPIRRIEGSPILWLARTSKRLRDRPLAVAAIAIGSYGLAMAYLAIGIGGGLNEGEGQAFFIIALLVIGAIQAAALTAASITAEKECQCWPLLLTTSLGDWRILRDKLLWVLREGRLVWLLLVGHLVVFTLAGVLHPIAMVLIGMLVVWTMLFVTGLALYFSVRLRRSTSAAMATFAVLLLIWLILPLILSLGSPDAAHICHMTNPTLQAGMIAKEATFDQPYASGGRPLKWPGESGSLEVIMGTVLATCLAFSGIGVLLLWRAKRMLRQYVF